MKTAGFQLMVCVMVLALAMMGGTGCAKHAPLQVPIADNGGKGGDGNTGGDGSMKEPPENIPWAPYEGLQTIYFDYNSFALRPDALKTLADNAAKIKQDANPLVQIEGHCDERGTQEYNLALGEKRALAVRDHLMKLRVPGDRLVTISYGKERPATDGHDESAWQKNRRSQFNRGGAK